MVEDRALALSRMDFKALTHEVLTAEEDAKRLREALGYALKELQSWAQRSGRLMSVLDMIDKAYRSPYHENWGADGRNAVMYAQAILKEFKDTGSGYRASWTVTPGGIVSCSVCEQPVFAGFASPFCPHCGRSMENAL